VGQEQLAIPVLSGEWSLTLDEKNRLMIPSDLRKFIGPEQGEGFFQVPSRDRLGNLWFYPVQMYEELAREAPVALDPTKAQLESDLYRFALASRLKWDSQGRVTLSERSLRRAGLWDAAENRATKEVVLVGARTHLILWKAPEWETELDRLEKRQNGETSNGVAT
jgi:MraZ protein